MLVHFLPLDGKIVHQDTLEVMYIDMISLDLDEDELDYIINFNPVYVVTYTDERGGEHDINCVLPRGERAIA